MVHTFSEKSQQNYLFKQPSIFKAFFHNHIWKGQFSHNQIVPKVDKITHLMCFINKGFRSDNGLLLKSTCFSYMYAAKYCLNDLLLLTAKIILQIANICNNKKIISAYITFWKMSNALVGFLVENYIFSIFST